MQNILEDAFSTPSGEASQVNRFWLQLALPASPFEPQHLWYTPVRLRTMLFWQRIDWVGWIMVCSLVDDVFILS